MYVFTPCSRFIIVSWVNTNDSVAIMITTEQLLCHSVYNTSFRLFYLDSFMLGLSMSCLCFMTLFYFISIGSFFFLSLFVFSKRAFKSFPELKDAIWDQYSVWTNRFGVLLFLYSVILTKVCGLFDYCACLH